MKSVVYLHQGGSVTEISESTLSNELEKCASKLAQIESEFGGSIAKARKSPRWKLWRSYERQLEQYAEIPF